MKIKVIENKILVESSITVEEFENVRRYAPEALKINDADGDEIFVVMIEDTSMVGDFGIAFNKYGDKLVAWLDMDKVEVPKKKYIEERYGMALARLKEVEAQVAQSLNDVRAKISTVTDSIEVIDEEETTAPNEFDHE